MGVIIIISLDSIHETVCTQKIFGWMIIDCSRKLTLITFKSLKNIEFFLPRTSTTKLVTLTITPIMARPNIIKSYQLVAPFIVTSSLESFKKNWAINLRWFTLVWYGDLDGLSFKLGKTINNRKLVSNMFSDVVLISCRIKK